MTAAPSISLSRRGFLAGAGALGALATTATLIGTAALLVALAWLITATGSWPAVTEGFVALGALGLAALAIGAALAWALSRSITQPLNHAVRLAQTVAAGDLTSRIEAGSKDEVGQLLDALKAMSVISTTKPFPAVPAPAMDLTAPTWYRPI